MHFVTVASSSHLVGLLWFYKNFVYTLYARGFSLSKVCRYEVLMKMFIMTGLSRLSIC